MRFAPLVALALCVVGAAAAPSHAAVTVKATLDRARVGVGEEADLGVEVQGVQSSGVPEIANAGGATVRYLGPAARVSFVNGAMSASVTHHFSVSAPRPGTVTLGPITVAVGDTRYDAGSVTLEVVAGNPGTGTGRGAGNPAGDQLRLELSAPRTTVYVRERLPIRVKLMVGQVRVTDVQYPTVPGDGFAVDKLSEPDQRQEQTPDGTFQVLDFATVLTPLRSGTLTVGPAEMGLTMAVRGRGAGRGFDRFFNDPFFGGEQRRLEATSDPLTLTVLPLPDAGKPADFSGAVGTFDFEVKAAPLEVAAGDPVTVTLTMRGTGSLENVTPPAIAAGDGLRVYPPQRTDTGASPAAANVQERTFEQVVIPERAGAMELPALRFSYFDPTAAAYRTATRAPIPLRVARRAAGSAPSHVIGAAPAAPAPKPETLGHDLVFIKDTPGRLRPVGARLYRSVAFWLVQAAALAAWVGVVAFDRQRRRLHGDAGYARFTRAGREARRALEAAKHALRPGNGTQFYDAVARALTDYLSAKLQLPPGAVAPDTVAAHLAGRGVGADVTQPVRDLLAHCEQVRFAPAAAGEEDMQHTLARADAIVRALERERRLGPPLAAMLAATLLAGVIAAGAAGAAEPPSETPQTLFFRGNTLYGDERYPEAIAAWEKVLAAGVESGNLHFNLGNAWFKTGDVGRAVLAYERARRLIPRDPDLHANLGYAREKSGDGDPTPLWARLAFPLAARASSDELVAGAGASFVLLMIALCAGRLLPNAARAGRIAALAAGIGLALAGTSAAYRIATVDAPRFAVVVAATDTDVRFEPSANGTAHFASKPGAVLRVLAEREGWAQVARPDGKRGWIARDTIAEL
ncbi:MAG: BatD family protein [Deltaproteobacteria bacterium]|nr:BatD family protein [Deltaproteobacteria bacterium]